MDSLFIDLWSEQGKKGSSNNYTEPRAEEGLDNVLKKLKNKAPGEDGLNLNLFRYAGKLFDRRILKILKHCFGMRAQYLKVGKKPL
jgi:hypothetical protein